VPSSLQLAFHHQNRDLSSIQPDTYKGLYRIHRYWGRKPPNVVRAYIEAYSNPGDLVLDPFVGSGVTVIESVVTGRRAIGVDINPLSILLTRTSISGADLVNVEEAFQRLKRSLAPAIDDYYATICPVCGSQATITHTIWQDSTPQEIWCRCQLCNTRKAVKEPSEEDLRRAMPSLPTKRELWLPDVRLIPNSRISAKPGMTVRDLFDPRNLIVLGRIYEAINKIDDALTREHLLLAFTAAVPQASRLVFVIRRRGNNRGAKKRSPTEVGSWVIGFWCPEEHFEVNAWACFERRVKKLLRGKRELFSRMSHGIMAEGNPAQVINGSATHAAVVGSAESIHWLPDESVAYIFTDPPHGDRQPYLELSAIWNAWLDSDVAFEDEIVVSDAPSRNKDEDEYFTRLRNALSEMRRVLKPNGKLTFAFNSLNNETWLQLTRLFSELGFALTQADTISYSAGSVVQDNRQKGLTNDLLITWEKTDDKFSVTSMTPTSIPEQAKRDLVCAFTGTRQGARISEILSATLRRGLAEQCLYDIDEIIEFINTYFTPDGLLWHPKRL